MEHRRCKRCGANMKGTKIGFWHCKCGTSWVAGKGYFTRTNSMNFTYEDQEIDGEIVRVPIIQEMDMTGKGRIKNEERIYPEPSKPYNRDTYQFIRGGIYHIREHLTEGSEIHSGRFAVVVSDVMMNGDNEVVTVVYLTSKEKPFSPTRTQITSSGIVSTVLAEQITTVDIHRIGSFKGLCSPQEMSAIKKCIVRHLGLGVNTENMEKNPETDRYIRQLEQKVKALEDELREQKSRADYLQRRLDSR